MSNADPSVSTPDGQQSEDTGQNENAPQSLQKPQNDLSNRGSDAEDDDQTSSLERSFEILNYSSYSNKQPFGPSMESGSHTTNAQNTDSLKQRADEDADKVDGPSVQGSPGTSKRSGSFLSKLTSSTSSNDKRESSDAANQNSFTSIPSNFANLISSVSFTSGFRRNSYVGNGANLSGVEGARDGIEQISSKLTIETASTSTGTSALSETREQIVYKKAVLERRNLISLTKLIVKDLISSSLTAGRTIDDHHQCAIHLNNYFTLLDRVLKHGLKPNILSNRSASLWNALETLPRYLSDKRLTSETVRSLAHTKTPDGRIRAWLRIAMMQKKLPEYFNELLANKNVLLKDIYHDFAFMLNDDAQVFAGLIIGVNVIDCNFFVKDDNFDMMDEVIDLSPYLRAANTFDEDDQQQPGPDSSQLENMTAVLDQKNYLEERSLHLETTVENLREKVKQLEEQKSRLELDAKVNEVRIQKLQSGATNKADTSSTNNDKTLFGGNFPLPDALKNLMNPSMDSKPSATSPDDLIEKLPQSNVTSNDQETTDSAKETSDSTEHSSQEQPLLKVDPTNSGILKDDLEIAQKLASDREKELISLRERVDILETSYRHSLEKIKVLERNLELQSAKSKEDQISIKMHQRDLNAKRLEIESLKSSLDDAKRQNSELNERLNDTGAKLKDRLNTVTSLQASLDKWKIENKTLATRYQDRLTALKTVTTQLDQSIKSIEELKKYNEKINDELRKERECGQSSSITVEEQIAKIDELTSRLRIMESELEDLRPYKEQMFDFKKRCQEYEQSLEEVGYQLRESRLEVERLKENSSVFLDSQWMDSKQIKSCALCQQTFSVTRRKHHCRLCGNVFCQTCSDNKMELASSSKPARVCDTCHAFLLAKFVKSSSASSTSALPKT